MSSSQTLMLSMVELRARCATVIAERQAPIKARQSRLRNLKLADHDAEAARLVKDAADSDDPESLLDKAAALLVGDDKINLMRELGEHAADLLDSKLQEIERAAANLGQIDFVLASLREQATKVQIARVGQIGRSGYVDANLEKFLNANVGALQSAIGLLRDRMNDPRITQACEQFSSDLLEFIDNVKSVVPA